MSSIAHSNLLLFNVSKSSIYLTVCPCVNSYGNSALYGLIRGSIVAGKVTC